MSKGSKRRKGLGYEDNWDAIFGKRNKHVAEVHTSKEPVPKDKLKNEDHDYKEQK